MNDDEVWAAIDHQRARTADLLQSLAIEHWDSASLCRGWTVRDVAAHLTLQEQGVADLIAFMFRHPRLLGVGSLNRLIRESAKVQAGLPMDEIIGRCRGMIGSRRHNAFVTHRETLIDILVHGQDIAIPLGLDLEMPVEVAAEAATRVWQSHGTRLAKVFRPLPLDAYRLAATDVDWCVGDGAEIVGPIRALLLLVTGRTALVSELGGPGAEEL